MTPVSIPDPFLLSIQSCLLRRRFFVFVLLHVFFTFESCKCIDGITDSATKTTTTKMPPMFPYSSSSMSASTVNVSDSLVKEHSMQHPPPHSVSSSYLSAFSLSGDSVSLTGHPLVYRMSSFRRNLQGNSAGRRQDQDLGRNACRCGHSSSTTGMLSRTAEETSGRVVGGRESDPGTFPWIVGLLDSFGFNFCGGALIKSNYILTAAHCLHNKRVEELTAVIGLNDLDMAFLFNRVYRLRQVILHPGFVHSNWSHDIALIKLSSPIVHLEPICLPERNQRYFDALIVAGWGKTSSHHSLNSLKPNKLHQVSLPQVDQYFCEQTWLDNYVANDQMCAGSAGKDTCIYDSGSPLMSFSGHGYRSASLAGVTSFGSRRCGDPDKPGVYTRVASYLDWIQVNTRDSVC